METAGDWPKIKEIVGAALEKEPSARSAFLDAACSHDEPLRREIDSLLAAYEQAGGLSGNPWDTGPAAEPMAATQVIGPYRLIRQLGVGGMGEVWLAEQTSPVIRLCALKLIKSGIYDPDAVRRFQAERQSIALMDHPSIAKVFDAGTTAAGQPYFAMEYVAGPSIVEYCDRNKLSIRERLILFVQVCEGVQHAHQKAIIHRDLKPSNILIVEVNGKPQPRIIDFGLARTISPDPLGETLFTRVGALLGTPGYMSPEQADPGVSDIDTRTDVYSLGVVLYELLTGFLPFRSERLKNQHLDEMMRELREATPQRPSTKFGKNLDVAAERASARGSHPGTLVGVLRGDLDWITMKALEKERDRRYGTPTELASDIERHLNNLPVLAGPASTAYRVRKYIRRHRLAVGVAGAGVALIATFAVMQAIQLRRITRERDRADRITEFMTNLFKVSDPSEARGNTVTAREILDKASLQIEAALGQDVEVQAQLMHVMALTYSGLGLDSRAYDLAQRALTLRQGALGPNDRKTLESTTQIGFILYHQGRDRDAEQLLRTAIARESKQLGPEDRLTLESEDDLGIVLIREGRYAEADALERAVLAIRKRKFGPEELTTLRSEIDLADALKEENKFEEADALIRELLATQERVLGKKNPNTLDTMQHLGNLMQDEGHYKEAEPIYGEALTIAESVLGPEHPFVAGTTLNLANAIRHDHTRWADAERLYRRALEITMRQSGAEDSNTTRAEEGLANLLSSEGKNAEAERLLQTVLTVRQHVLGPDHTDTLITEYNLGSVLFNEGKYAQAEQLLRDTLNAQTRTLGPEHPDTLASATLLSNILLSEGRPEESEAVARRTFTTQLRVLGPQHEDTLDSLHALGDAMAKNHHYDDARKLFPEVIGKIAAVKEGDTSVAWYDFACAAALAGRRDEAFEYLNKAVKAGYVDGKRMRSEEDLKSLHGDRRFAEVSALSKPSLH